MKPDLEQLKERAAIERAKVMDVEYIVADQSEDDEEPSFNLTPSGVRMARKRKREKNAQLYWRLRLVTGAQMDALISDALFNAPKIVEAERKKALQRYRGFAEQFPERCAAVSVTEIKFKKCDAV